MEHLRRRGRLVDIFSTISSSFLLFHARLSDRVRIKVTWFKANQDPTCSLIVGGRCNIDVSYFLVEICQNSLKFVQYGKKSNTGLFPTMVNISAPHKPFQGLPPPFYRRGKVCRRMRRNFARDNQNVFIQRFRPIFRFTLYETLHAKLVPCLHISLTREFPVVVRMSGIIFWLSINEFSFNLTYFVRDLSEVLYQVMDLVTCWAMKKIRKNVPVWRTHINLRGPACHKIDACISYCIKILIHRSRTVPFSAFWDFCFIINHISWLESWIKVRAHANFSQSGAKWPLFRCTVVSLVLWGWV